MKVVNEMINITLKNRVRTRIMIAETGKGLRDFSKMIGISHAYLSQILNGKKNPSPTVAHKIATGLSLEIKDIFLIETVDSSTKKEEQLSR